MPGKIPPAADVRVAPEIADLVARAAEIPYGLEFLLHGYPESVAVTLGVHPSVVARARALLETPGERETLFELFAEEVERNKRDPPEPRRAPEAARGSCGPEELVRSAESHPLGVAFLVEAPVESVAVTFGVHPFVVLGARELLRKRGPRPPEGAG